MKVNINKLMKYPSWVSKYLGAIDICDDEEIKARIEEVRSVNEESDLEELPLVEPTLELKPLPSSLQYNFLDT